MKDVTEIEDLYTLAGEVCILQKVPVKVAILSPTS